MTTENRPLALPSLHRPSRWTKARQSNSKSGTPPVRNVTSLWLPCTIGMRTAPSSSTTSHKLYAFLNTFPTRKKKKEVEHKC